MKKNRYKKELTGVFWISILVAIIFLVIILIVGLVSLSDKEQFKITLDGKNVDEIIISRGSSCNTYDDYITCGGATDVISKEDLTIDWLDENCECLLCDTNGEDC